MKQYKIYAIYVDLSPGKTNYSWQNTWKIAQNGHMKQHKHKSTLTAWGHMKAGVVASEQSNS